MVNELVQKAPARVRKCELLTYLRFNDDGSTNLCSGCRNSACPEGEKAIILGRRKFFPQASDANKQEFEKVAARFNADADQQKAICEGQ